MKISNPEHTVDRIVERMKEAAARGQAASTGTSRLEDSASPLEWGAAGNNSSTPAAIELQPLKLQAQFEPHVNDFYHVNDLVQYHDRNFIQNAYRAILKRGPDAVGYEGFIESLHSGRLNKIDILARLRYSKEGRAKRVQVAGLLVPAMIRALYRLPMIGYLLNLVTAIFRLPVMVRSQRQFESHALAQQELIADHLNHVAQALQAFARQVAGFQAHTQQVSREQRTNYEAILREQTTNYEAILREQRTNYEALLGEQRSNYEVILGRIADLTSHFEQATSKWQKELAIQQTEVHQQRTNYEVMLGRIGKLTNHFEDATSQWQEGLRTSRAEVYELSEDLQQQLKQVLQKEQQVSVELALQGQRLTTLLEEARTRLTEPFDGQQLLAISNEEDHSLDAFYASFDEQFRGTSEEIKERLRIYLPIIAKNGVGSEEMPILDVGCGRGEWLELLQQEQLRASGVDSNRILVAQCRDRGLEVVEEDLMDHLRAIPDASLGAVTGFHVVEHLPVETLVKFLDQTVRILKPGGVVIFETPNPQNVLVGTCNFYFDPTHRNPLPSQVMRFLVESKGFVDVEVLQLNPSDAKPIAGDSEVVKRFNEYFYGPMDYAVIGWRA